MDEFDTAGFLTGGGEEGSARESRNERDDFSRWGLDGALAADEKRRRKARKAKREKALAASEAGRAF